MNDTRKILTEFATHVNRKANSVVVSDNDIESFLSMPIATCCACGNPSGEGYVHFRGDEELVYICVDCEKELSNTENE